MMGVGRLLCALLAVLALLACKDPYVAGRQAFDSKQWTTAIDRLERVDPFHLHYRDAQDLIRQSTYNAGIEAFDNARYTACVGFLKQVKESDPNYASARDYIGASFYEQAARALREGDAREALRLSNIVRSTCSRYEQARELAHDAQRLIDRRQLEVAAAGS